MTHIQQLHFSMEVLFELLLPNDQGFGSGVFAWIRIRFLNFSGSGSGSGFSPDSGTKKNAERSIKVIDQKKT